MTQEIDRTRGALAAIRPALADVEALTSATLPAEVFDTPAMRERLAGALATLAELAADAAGLRLVPTEPTTGQCPAGVRDPRDVGAPWERCRLPVDHDGSHDFPPVGLGRLMTPAIG